MIFHSYVKLPEVRGLFRIFRMTAEVPRNMQLFQRKLDTLKTALVDCSSVRRRFHHILCGDVRQTENHQPERALALGPRDLAHLAAWFDRFDRFDGFDRFGSQAIPKFHASTYAAHIFHILLGASLSASVGVSIPIPKPQSEYSPNPELVNTGNIIPYSSVIFRVSLGVLVLPQQHLQILQALL